MMFKDVRLSLVGFLLRYHNVLGLLAPTTKISMVKEGFVLEIEIEGKGVRSYVLTKDGQYAKREGDNEFLDSYLHKLAKRSHDIVANDLVVLKPAIDSREEISDV